MPDLTREYHWHCLTAENWQKEVKGSKGDTYIVRWDRHSHKSQHEVEHDWSCTCMAYRKRKGYCKHIEAVMKLEHPEGRCGWMQYHDGGSPKDDKCPRCGGEIRSQAYAV
jgi:hypothetical protein